jgi:ABC-type amino acid transport substrate-binding protein
MKREMNKKLTRREVLKISGGLAACAPAASQKSALMADVPGSSPSGAKEALPVYKVVRPTGDLVVQMITQAPRLGNLDGKTICMAINGSFKSWITAPIIEDLLHKRYPNAKVIPFTDMPRSDRPPGPTTNPSADAMIAALKQKGCQAIISGNGG